MEPLDVIEHIGPDFGQYPGAPLAFELAEEALRGRVVAAMTHIARAADNAVAFQDY